MTCPSSLELVAISCKINERLRFVEDGEFSKLAGGRLGEHLETFDSREKAEQRRAEVRLSRPNGDGHGPRHI